MAAGWRRWPRRTARSRYPVSSMLRRKPWHATATSPIELTNLKKVFWPDEGYTKGDLVAYYRAISPWLLPYLRDRPMVMTRYPDGIGGKSFFQKDAPGFAPEWIRIERMWSETRSARSTTSSATTSRRCSTSSTSARSRCTSGPAERPRSSARTGACSISIRRGRRSRTWSRWRSRRARCARASSCPLSEDVRLDGAARAHSARAPVHLRAVAHAGRAAGALRGRAAARDRHHHATGLAAGGRVYIDYLQNGPGKLLVSPFCVRPLPGAPVSTPLAWREVNRKLDIRRHTMVTVPERMKKLKTDPLAEVVELVPDLGDALGRLQEELA